MLAPNLSKRAVVLELMAIFDGAYDPGHSLWLASGICLDLFYKCINDPPRDLLQFSLQTG